MANLTFYPVRRKGQKPTDTTSIMCEARYRVGSKERRLRFTVPDIKIKVRHFSNQRIIPQAAHSSSINDRLAAIEQRFEELLHAYHNAGEFPSPEELKEGLLAKEVVKERKGIHEGVNDYLEHIKNVGATREYLANVKVCLNELARFEAKTGYQLSYSSMNLTFFGKYLAHLREKGLAHNTIARYIKRLRLFLKHAARPDVGWSIFGHYEQFKFTEKSVPKENLTEDEIQRLWELPLAENETGLEKSRDWIVLVTQLGIRNGDWKHVKKENLVEVDGGMDLVIRQTQKTGVQVVIPISQLAYEVLSKHDFNMPDPQTNQVFNRRLKSLAEKAGISKSISTHTARRSFASNMERAGHPRQWIMKITGHTKEDVYLRYVGIEGEENAARVRKGDARFQLTATKGGAKVVEFKTKTA
jgi:site-specific recombinase XerD